MKRLVSQGIARKCPEVIEVCYQVQEGSSCGLPFSLLVSVLNVYWFLRSQQVPVHSEKAIRDYGVLAAELGHWSLQATRCLARLIGNPKSLEW